ncbi:trypsin-like serine peptidase [Candidatus Paracaedibacter symbiosus]|uniref:trypsin-like serine peptidase n=1 Tax=Candidatus Paracaedibacter symbiosus TaxID=244582 RepID=UPI000509D9A7|nr:trypsin-like serine protease [Candidatus Paracaedibacter symbiosus]
MKQIFFWVNLILLSHISFAFSTEEGDFDSLLRSLKLFTNEIQNISPDQRLQLGEALEEARRKTLDISGINDQDATSHDHDLYRISNLELHIPYCIKLDDNSLRAGEIEKKINELKEIYERIKANRDEQSTFPWPYRDEQSTSYIFPDNSPIQNGHPYNTPAQGNPPPYKLEKRKHWETYKNKDEFTEVLSPHNWPYSVHGKLKIEFEGSSGFAIGTGTLIGDRHVLTAGHCIKEFEKEAYRITFYHAVCTENPPQSFKWESRLGDFALIVKGWTEGSEEDEYDYGLVVLKNPIIQKNFLVFQ